MLGVAARTITKEASMANIVRKNPNETIEWNPWRAMRDLVHWDPFREMSPFAGFPFREYAKLPAEWNPSFDVTENKDAYMFKADLPGVKLEDLEITATGNRLQIVGKRDTSHETKTDTVYAFERQYGTFTRAFTLPDGADLGHATSELKDGVLTLVIPKTVAATAKKIPISISSSKS
jgi:HSP20 family protein